MKSKRYPHLRNAPFFSDFAYLKPRNEVELQHQVLKAMFEAKCTFIEPTFLLSATPQKIESTYSRLAQQLEKIVASSPDGPPENHPSFQQEWVHTQADQEGRPKKRQNFFHNDECGTVSSSDLLLMCTLVPAEEGGYNEYVPVDIIDFVLENTAPELRTRIHCTPVIFDTPEGTTSDFLLSGNTPKAISCWDYKKVSADNTNAAKSMVEHFHQFIESYDWKQFSTRASTSIGSATLWWDKHLMHRRIQETGKTASRKVSLYKIKKTTGDIPPSQKNALSIAHNASSTALMNTLYGHIEKMVMQHDIRSNASPLLVGISGPNAAGKTTFAQQLAKECNGQSLKASTVSVDDFHFPTSHRYRPAGREAFLEAYFDIPLLQELLIANNTGTSRFQIPRLDFVADEYTAKAITENADLDILIVEGVFLFRPELADFFDLKIYVHAPFPSMVARGIERWATQHSVFSTADRFLWRYVPAQMEHISLHQPHKIADIVIDNSDYTCPSFVRGCDLDFLWPLRQ